MSHRTWHVPYSCNQRILLHTVCCSASTITDILSVDELVDFLSLAVKYHLSLTSKIRLLCGLLSMPAPIIISTASTVEPVVRTLFASCYPFFCEGKLAHNQLLHQARLKVPCSMCRCEPPNLPVMPVISEHSFTVCSSCHSTLCAACTSKPCLTMLERL
uniref:Uncharacterized protein n=1 Tax=Ditylenchus dipsaci TaxID=166011 RepID=A0A915CZ91_9BILA